jgi:hypothetical protein
MGRPGLFIAGGVGSAGTCAVDQQDTLGMLVKDDRQGPLDSWYVVLGAAAGHQEPERLALTCSPPLSADHRSGCVPT